METVEKKFNVKVAFDKAESNMFGGLSNSVTVLIVPESVKDQLLKEFKNQDSVIAVRLAADSKGFEPTRYINCRNILYIEVVEIADEQASKLLPLN